MKSGTKRALQIGAILLVALALTALPGGDSTLAVVLTLLSLVFFAAIAILGYRLFRQFRPELETLADRVRLVLYGSVGAAFLTFCATNRMFDSGGLGVLAWLALLALCSYGVYWVWLQYRGDRSY
jgi:drug/metabolite transporter (DMT)-like permease